MSPPCYSRLPLEISVQTTQRASCCTISAFSVREPGLISDPKVNFSYFEIAMGRYGEVWARRNVYSAPPRYYKCTATHATPI